MQSKKYNTVLITNYVLPYLILSALGSALVIVGLYFVLWAKTKEASDAPPSSNINALDGEEKSKQATQQKEDV